MPLNLRGEEVSQSNLENPAGSSPGGSCQSFCSDLVPGSSCSGDEFNKFLNHSFKFSDLEQKISETFNSNHSKFIETTPTSELRGASDESHTPKSKLQKTDYWRSFPAMKMPSIAEIEEFFADTEKLERKRFADKYNFDIVKDKPLEGRYQWIRWTP